MTIMITRGLVTALVMVMVRTTMVVKAMKKREAVIMERKEAESLKLQVNHYNSHSNYNNLEPLDSPIAGEEHKVQYLNRRVVLALALGSALFLSLFLLHLYLVFLRRVHLRRKEGKQDCWWRRSIGWCDLILIKS